MADALATLITEELSQPVDPRVNAFAAVLAGLYPDATQAVLFYGSCLRTDRLEGEMLDFYVIVSDYEAAYGKSWMVRANALIPPNVFPAEHEGLIAKYAVLSMDDFHRLNRPDASTVSVWARFAQPSRLVWSAGEAAVSQSVEALSGAAPTLLNAGIADHGSGKADIADLWHRGFMLTYGAELRAERKTRAQSVVEFDPERYRAFTSAVLDKTIFNAALDDGMVSIAHDQQDAITAERARWPKLRRRGKLISLVRLIKASGTYAGGIDYLAWKINRHAGTKIAIRPWQRKWPVIGALSILPRLLVKGAVR